MEFNTTIAWYKRPDMIVGLSALMVSLVAVLVGVYSAYVDRAYARASVWPSVQLARSYNSDEEQASFAYLAINNGTGPALIKSVKITLKGQPVANWSEFLRLTNIVQPSYVQSQLNNSVIPANQRIVAIQSTDKKLVDGLLALEEHMQVEICYCSIYDECWQVNKNNQVSDVASCELLTELQFLQ
jgi:hypothetical protein